MIQISQTGQTYTLTLTGGDADAMREALAQLGQPLVQQLCDNLGASLRLLTQQTARDATWQKLQELPAADKAQLLSDLDAKHAAKGKPK